MAQRRASPTADDRLRLMSTQPTSPPTPAGSPSRRSCASTRAAPTPTSSCRSCWPTPTSTHADKGFVTELVYGSTRRKRALDHVVDRFLVQDPPPVARAALRIGAHQLIEMGTHRPCRGVGDRRRPHRSGSGEWSTPSCARSPRRRRPGIEYPSLAVELSYPDWMVGSPVRRAGQRRPRTAALRMMNEPAVVQRRDDGYIQDESSQRVAGARAVRRPGDVVLDMCAAPGERPPRSPAGRRDRGRGRPAEAQPGRLIARQCRSDSVSSTVALDPGRRDGAAVRHRRRSTRCWSMRRAPVSARCVVVPMPAGESPPTTSTRWDELQARSARAPRRLSCAPVGVSSTASARSPAGIGRGRGRDGRSAGRARFRRRRATTETAGDPSAAGVEVLEPGPAARRHVSSPLPARAERDSLSSGHGTRSCITTHESGGGRLPRQDPHGLRRRGPRDPRGRVGCHPRGAHGCRRVDGRRAHGDRGRRTPGGATRSANWPMVSTV